MWSPELYFIQAFLLCVFLIFALILTLMIVVFAAILLKPPYRQKAPEARGGRFSSRAGGLEEWEV